MTDLGIGQIGSKSALLFAAAALSCTALILLLHPLLVRYATARPNARSSHREPTPQGGGIAVIGATALVLVCATLLAPALFTDPFRLALIFASVIALAMVGVTDDIHPLEALPRLVLQAVAVLVVIAILPSGLRIVSALPFWFERALIFIAMLWFVNLVNFMDGIDWMTVAEVVPVTAALALFGLMGALPSDATLVSLALCGAMVGFAPFNRPVARLFLGDVGSLPVGLLLGWLLVLLADRHLAAALLLPLYYVADATVTLLLRFVRGEPVTQAHRSHFYQRALDGGFSVYQIVERVFLVNVTLAGLGLLTALTDSFTVQIISVVTGSAVVGALLCHFSRRQKASL
jgi:UDP-N-acetylmuramyl pentapeptide phosphotransferase/UDP-N-acetylglucosamine-1-phosphate transferase